MRQVQITFVALLALAGPAAAGPPGKADLRVLYLGSPDTPRGKAYARFLGEHFRRAESAARVGFDPKRARDFDVVLLDWPQEERPARPSSPLGPREAWGRPTVLLGSAGLMLAEAWEVHGAIG
jgi:hypothetical protein